MPRLCSMPIPLCPSLTIVFWWTMSRISVRSTGRKAIEWLSSPLRCGVVNMPWCLILMAMRYPLLTCRTSEASRDRTPGEEQPLLPQGEDAWYDVTARQRLTCGRDGCTGLFTAYLAKRWLGLSGAEALQWVRRFIPRAVETSEQQRLILHDDEFPKAQSRR